jgi:hypothetical protein
MAVTKEELTDFHRFAVGRLSNGGAESMQELLNQWSARREHQESVAGIRESIGQYEAGHALPVKEAFDEIRQKLGWTQ